MQSNSVRLCPADRDWAASPETCALLLCHLVASGKPLSLPACRMPNSSVKGAEAHPGQRL